MTETQKWFKWSKWKAVMTNVHVSFVQAIEKAVVLFCVNSPCKGYEEERGVQYGSIELQFEKRET